MNEALLEEIKEATQKHLLELGYDSIGNDVWINGTTSFNMYGGLDVVTPFCNGKLYNLKEVLGRSFENIIREILIKRKYTDEVRFQKIEDLFGVYGIKIYLQKSTFINKLKDAD